LGVRGIKIRAEEVEAKVMIGGRGIIAPGKINRSIGEVNRKDFWGNVLEPLSVGERKARGRYFQSSILRVRKVRIKTRERTFLIDRKEDKHLPSRVTGSNRVEEVRKHGFPFGRGRVEGVEG
jgi:hypothetical protein